MSAHSEMVERVARVLARTENQRQLDTGFAWPEDLKGGDLEADWQEYESDARAAIKAMREPTDAMVEAGERESFGSVKSTYARYQAMINKALEGDQS